jgi:prophage regulatory protein
MRLNWSAAMDDFSIQLFRLRDVEKLTGLSKSSVYRLEALNEFPQRVKLSARASAWKSDEILAWMAARPRANPAATRAA